MRAGRAATSRDPQRSNCPGRTSRWSTATPKPGLDGLKEYQGDPDEIAEFIGEAQILVTHLAPVSAGMLDRLPRSEADRRLARRPGQHRHGGGARARRARSSTRPAATPRAVAEFTIGAILAETRLITRGHESLRRGEWRGDLYRADLTGDELSEMTVGVIGYGHDRHPGGAGCSSRSAAGSWSAIPMCSFGRRIMPTASSMSDLDTLAGAVGRRQPACARHRGDHAASSPPPQFARDEAGRLLHQHGARPAGRL